MHPAFVFQPGTRLSLCELSAARLDGHVVELGAVYIPADLVESREARAASLSPLITAGMVASGPSAAWIHGASAAPPAPHHAHRATSRRLRVTSGRLLTFHDGLVDPEQLEHIAGVAVTTPLRTMEDLALGVHREPGYLPWLRALAEIRPHVVGATREALHRRRRVPGLHRALDEVERLAALDEEGRRTQDEVTR